MSLPLLAHMLGGGAFLLELLVARLEDPAQRARAAPAPALRRGDARLPRRRLRRGDHAGALRRGARALPGADGGTRPRGRTAADPVHGALPRDPVAGRGRAGAGARVPRRRRGARRHRGAGRRLRALRARRRRGGDRARTPQRQRPAAGLGERAGAARGPMAHDPALAPAAADERRRRARGAHRHDDDGAARVGRAHRGARARAAGARLRRGARRQRRAPDDEGRRGAARALAARAAVRRRRGTGARGRRFHRGGVRARR